MNIFMPKPLKESMRTKTVLTLPLIPLIPPTMSNKENKTWEERFDEQFGENIVWWQECICEMRIGDPDFKRLKSFISQELKQQREEELRFILNILDGIDIADKQMGNKGGGTKAIRLALQSRIIPTDT